MKTILKTIGVVVAGSGLRSQCTHMAMGQTMGAASVVAILMGAPITENRFEGYRGPGNGNWSRPRVNHSKSE